MGSNFNLMNAGTISHGYATDISGSSKTHGASIVQATSGGSTDTSQQWNLVALTNSYQYEGKEAHFSGYAGSTAGWGQSGSSDWATVNGARQGTGVAGTTDPTLIGEGTTQADQCDNMYHDAFHPTTLEFTIHAPSLRVGDNTLPLIPAPNFGANGNYNTVVPTAGMTITIGANPVNAGAEFQATQVNPSCTGTCTLVGTHAFEWLTLAEAYNPGPVPVYIRVTVQAVVGSAYWPLNAASDPYPATDHPFDAYGQADSGTYGTGGNVFALGLCDGAVVTEQYGTHSNTDSSADPSEYGDIFNVGDWTPADTSGLDPDKGCPDPNLDTAFTSGATPVVTSDMRFQVNARDGMCIITLSAASSGTLTDYIPLAELGPAFAGKTITVRLFDAGDVTSASNYLSILQPTDNPKDANVSSGTYVGTEYSGGNSHLYPAGQSFKSYPYYLDILSPPGTHYSDAGSNRPPFWDGTDYDADNPPSGRLAWRPLTNENPIDQGVQVSNNGNNSFANCVWLEFQVTVPTNYIPLPGQDWWTVAYNLTGLTSGSHADDTTTWQIASSAAPVQLLSGQ